MSTFEDAFRVVVGEEGGYTDNPADPGNWTSGKVGQGALRGTKFGISARSYPDLPIASLSVQDAADIYRRDFWIPIQADALPQPLALLLFDAAVNCGCGRAIRWLQQAVSATVDGRMGPLTLDAVAKWAAQPSGGAKLCAEFLALRLAFMASLPTWRSFGAGWARRLRRLPYESMSYTS